LVKKSATMSPLGQYLTLNSSLAMQSDMKKYWMSMCLVLHPLEALQFFACSLVLWLSWNTTLLHTSNPCAPRKLQVQMTSGIPSSTPTNSTSVELLVLRCCFQEGEYMDPFPSDMIPLVWLHMSRCTVNDASIHHLMAMTSSVSSVRRRSFNPWRYQIHCLSFFQSSSSGRLCHLSCEEQDHSL
jgi:hypothetical protein